MITSVNHQPVQKFTMTLRDYWKNALPAKSFDTVLKKIEMPTADNKPQAPSQPHPSRPSHDMVAQAIQEAGQKYDVPEKLIESVIKVESNFNPKAVSHCGAQGLMQLMPGTAKELGVKNSFDIRENIEGGVKYLRKMLDRFGQNVRNAVAAYNAGPGAVAKHDGVPPYKETKNYVERVLKNYTA